MSLSLGIFEKLNELSNVSILTIRKQKFQNHNCNLFKLITILRPGAGRRWWGEYVQINDFSHLVLLHVHERPVIYLGKRLLSAVLRGIFFQFRKCSFQFIERINSAPLTISRASELTAGPSCHVSIRRV